MNVIFAGCLTLALLWGAVAAALLARRSAAAQRAGTVLASSLLVGLFLAIGLASFYWTMG